MPAFSNHNVPVDSVPQEAPVSMTDLTGFSEDDLQQLLAAGDADGLNQEAQGSLIGAITIAAHC